MNYNFLLYNVESRIASITLNRPEKRNALSFELVSELKNAISDAEKNNDVKIILLKANGEAFCAGADLGYLQQLQKNTFEENLADSNHLKELFEKIYTSSKLVIAQIEGAALAGGCGLATVCDFSFATAESKFGFTEVKIGFVPAIVMYFLLRKIGEGKAKQLLLSGEIIDATKAQQLGLINEVIEQENIREYVHEFCQKLIKQTSSQSIALTKKMIAEMQHLSYIEGLDFAANQNANARATDDCKKGISAFLNKEKISW
jgi:methylglutaconyl-CoA hydratase